ncbi:MAG: caspase family protein [Caldimonas sp.]
MPLDIVSSRLGLWRHPEWKVGMPGVYALVAGVSAYDHLAGGTGTAAPDSHGLEQLLSSANTAASIFQWLRQSFRRREMPVVWCYVLLSPTAAERAVFEADGLSHYAAPSYLNLQQAIQLWTGNVPKAADEARASRSLFFFSGHGVQSNWNALLLPSDYLDPELGQPPHYENCISTVELRKWMEENPVGEHLALIDACRNEYSPLASKGATAHSVFPTNPPGGMAPRTAATLAAASPNTIAYQLQDRPLTLFGEAVLEAVRGVADPTRTELPFRELVDYVKPRVNVLLKEAARTTLEQSVRPRVDGDDNLVVTEIDRAAAREAAPAGMRSGPARGGSASPVSLPARPQGVGAALAVGERAAATLIFVNAPIKLADLRAGGEAHRRFGHEYASEIWMAGGVALYSMRDGTRLANGATVLAVSRDGPSSIVHVDLALDPGSGGVLLVFEGDAFVQRKRLAVALPTDRNERVPARLTIGIDRAEPGRPFMIQSLKARLGPGYWNLHYTYLWELTQHARLASVIQAADAAEPARLKQAVEDKEKGQAAAVAGMMLLARAGQLDRVEDWARNLMNWFPDIPDGAVLWAESLRDGLSRGVPAPWGVTDPANEMAVALMALFSRGVPFFADSIEMADRLVRHLLRGELLPERRRALETLAHALGRIFDIAMPAGDFVVLSGWPRPAWLDTGQGAISVREMLRALRGPLL